MIVYLFRFVVLGCVSGLCISTAVLLWFNVLVDGITAFVKSLFPEREWNTIR